MRHSKKDPERDAILARRDRMTPEERARFDEERERILGLTPPCVRVCAPHGVFGGASVMGAMMRAVESGPVAKEHY